jgi:hypothetical protein
MFRTFMAVIAFTVWVGAAQAQSSEPATIDRGPKSLLESISGNNSGGKENARPGEEDRLDPDRPHFPEASTAVGKGRAILESGYTFTRKGTSFLQHSYPEALLRVGMFAELRVGMFADWFEFRVGQSFLNERHTTENMTTSANGAQDLYLGMKLAVTEQRGLLPAMVLIPQMTVPTGSSGVTAGRILPGLNVDCGWEVIPKFFSIELLVANNFVEDEISGSRHELATGLTAAFQITKKLEGFVEWDAFYPTGGVAPKGPRNYAVGGL